MSKTERDEESERSSDDFTELAQPGYFPRYDEEMERVHEELEHLRRRAKKGEHERSEIMDRVARQSHWSVEDTFKSAIIAAFGLGVLGLIASLALGGYGFSLMFALGLMFVAYAHWHGLPQYR